MTTKQIEGYLAYIDLQGFSELIKTIKFNEKFQKFYNIIEEAIKVGGTDIYYTFFSDSIVIYTEELSSKKFIEIAGILSQVNYNLTDKLELVISGGLSCGNFSLHEHKNNVIFAGSPMVDAVKIQEAQNWLGITISPEVIKKEPAFITMLSYPFYHMNIDYLNKELSYPEVLYYVQDYETIPVKSLNNQDDSISGFIIVPQMLNPKNPSEAALNILCYKDDLLLMKYYASTSHVQQKYQNTTDVMSALHFRYDDITRNSKAIHTTY